MKPFLIILLSLSIFFTGQAQQFRNADLLAMIDLIDEHLNLNEYQKKEVTTILGDALQTFESIQHSDKTDIEKLSLMAKNQSTTRSQLEVVLNNDQLEAYKALLDGTQNTTLSVTSTATEVPTSQMNSNNTNVVVDGSAASIAKKLGFTGNAKDQFIVAYDRQQAAIESVKNSGIITTESGIDLLTSILVTDFKIIDLGGRSTYENYFQLRSSGQLSPDGSASNGQDVDIAQVYQLYDLKTALNLSDQQTDTFIRLILESEAEKREIKSQYSGSERAKKLKVLENKSLQQLQQLLTTEQIQKLGQILGG
ncbi:MAG: hypothetical protein KDD32_00040 [Bacteroidetes bacterium]|nr:hypothetical protein [Bacteroidota bacterium]